MNKENVQTEMISVKQAKLLGSAQRVKIIRALAETAKTAKQVADELRYSPGSIHYHIQQLYEGQLIDLVETRMNGGILEKYYIAKSQWFNTPGSQWIDSVLANEHEGDSSTKLSLRMLLTPEQREELTADFKALLEKWVTITSKYNAEDSSEFAIGINMIATTKSKAE